MHTQKRVFWNNKPGDSYPALSGIENTKHLVVGAGICGLSSAYFLLKNGAKDIVLIEQKHVGNGSTGSSAGMYVAEPEQGPWEAFIAKYGAKNAHLYWREQKAALKTIADLVKNEGLDCDFVSGDLMMLAGNPLGRTHILHDFQARKVMKMPVHMLGGEELDMEPVNPAYDIGERTRAEASINPLKLARSLAKYLKKRGVRIYENTPLLKIKSSTAIVPGGKINFGSVICSMGVWTDNPRIERYLTTITITRKLTEKEIRQIGLADRAMFLDDENRSFHYAKLTKDKRLLVGYGDILCAGPENKEILHKPHLNNIKGFLKRVFPKVDMSIEYAWSAEYALSKGLLPLVSIKGNKATIGGAGTQLTSIVIASYAASKILNKKHNLDILFSDSKTSKLKKRAHYNSEEIAWRGERFDV